jgi:hypothetical protein
LIQPTDKVNLKGSGTGIVGQMKDNTLALQVALWECTAGNDDTVSDEQICIAIDAIVAQLRRDAITLRKWLL